MGSETLRNITLSTGMKSKSGLHWFWLAVLSTAPLLPLSNFVGHPHWEIIRWIPFQDFALSPGMLKDVIGNIVWFTMIGYLLHDRLNHDSAPRRMISAIALIAGGLSLSIEFFQVFCHNRIPSTTDVICDGIGAGLGGYFASKQRTVLIQSQPVARGSEPAG